MIYWYYIAIIIRLKGVNIKSNIKYYIKIKENGLSKIILLFFYSSLSFFLKLGYCDSFIIKNHDYGNLQFNRVLDGFAYS